MRVRLLTAPLHYWGSSAWPPVGSVLDVPRSLGEHMVAHGEAVEEPAPAPEAAAIEPSERAVRPAAKTRRLKP